MSCPQCSNVQPIQDQGIIGLTAKRPWLHEKLESLFNEKPWLDSAAGSPAGAGLYRYASREQLLQALRVLNDSLRDQEQSEVEIEIHNDGNSAALITSLTGRLPLSQFFARMKHYDLVRMMSEARFSSHMQPIVDIDSRQVFGYEFVLRPAEGHPPFQPYELFRVAQQTGLHSFLDRSARISAIQTSARLLPKGIKRFINFLPSSIYNPNYCLSHTFQAIDQLDLDPRDFVFEVVETEQIEDIGHLRRIFDVYREHGVKVALDDVGSGFSTLEVLAELKPDYVKIDRSLVDQCDLDGDKQKVISKIVEVSRSFGADVLAEGMERKEEWEFCKSRDIALAQGYLLGKPAPSPLDSGTVVV